VSLQSEFAGIAAKDGRAALVTVIAGDPLGAKLLVRADGSSEGSLGSEELDRAGASAAEELLWAERSETREVGETSLFVDVVAPAPRLVVIVAWPDEAFARLGGIDRATYIAVLTHDPKLDDAALAIALNSDAAYVGAMGSRRAQAQRRERLLAAGLEEELLERVAAPIGLDLGAVSPEETALSIMAEVVAVRNGRDGGRLSQSGGRIHEVGA
jgi:xanthine dehydrogenase accessory factor